MDGWHHGNVEKMSTLDPIQLASPSVTVATQRTRSHAPPCGHGVARAARPVVPRPARSRHRWCVRENQWEFMGSTRYQPLPTSTGVGFLPSIVLANWRTITICVFVEKCKANKGKQVLSFCQLSIVKQFNACFSHQVSWNSGSSWFQQSCAATATENIAHPYSESRLLTS